MFSEPSGFKSGFIALAGRPNVGKSTLINALLGQKVTAVSPRPQTTRKRQLGILNLDNAQLIFVDTPGIHRPKHKLGEAMNFEATESIEECDLVLFIVDVSAPPTPEDRIVAETLRQLKTTPILLLLNKVDLVSDEQLQNHRGQYETLAPQANALTISATRGDHLDKLIEILLDILPEGPAFFPEDQITDLYERDIAADLIREAALIHLRDEVPHCLAVRIDDFKERDDRGAYIAATIFVERESQKPILIGKRGAMLKTIGTHARKEIEIMSGRKVYLDLRVKLRKNWRNDPSTLRLFGYRLEKKRK